MKDLSNMDSMFAEAGRYSSCTYEQHQRERNTPKIVHLRQLREDDPTSVASIKLLGEPAICTFPPLGFREMTQGERSRSIGPSSFPYPNVGSTGV